MPHLWCILGYGGVRASLKPEPTIGISKRERPAAIPAAHSRLGRIGAPRTWTGGAR